MRRHFGTVLVVIACALLMVWRYPPHGLVGNPEQQNEVLFKRLAEPTSVSYQGESLSAAMAELGRRHEVEIDISPVAFSDLGERLSMPVELNFADISLETALTLLVHEAGELAWSVQGGKIWIMPLAQRNDSTRYHVGQLHVIPAAAAGANGIDAEQLSYVVESVIAVDSWEEVGGPAAITPIPNAVAVSNDTRTQQLVRSLVEALVHVERHPGQIAPIDVNAFSGRCRRLHERLSRRIAVDFDDVPTQDALNYLATQYDLPLYLDKQALKELGVDISYETSTLRLSDAKVSTVLRSLLRTVDLVAQPRGEVVYITSPDMADQHLTIRVYPIQDLERVGGDADTLMQLIAVQVDPDCWDSVGGYASIMGCTQGLVIACRDELHQKIERLLGGLRQRLDPALWRSAGGPVPEGLNPQVSFEYRDEPLHLVLSQLQEKHGVNLVLDEKALAESGILRNFKVGGAARQMPLFDALRQLLIPFGMDVAVDDDVLLITSHQQWERQLTIQIYDSRALVIDPFQTPSAAHDFDTLIDAIESTIDPDSWDMVGGEGSINGVADLLIVTQTVPVHQSIERLLKALRQLPDEVQGSDIDKEIHTDPLHPIVLEGESVGSAWTLRLYALTQSMEKPDVMALSDAINAQCVDWADDGGEGELIALEVAGRSALLIRQKPEAHRTIRGIVENASQHEGDGK